VSGPPQFDTWDEAISLGLFHGKLNHAAFVVALGLKLSRQGDRPLDPMAAHWLEHEATPDDLREIAKFLEIKSDKFNKYRLQALRSYVASFSGRVQPTLSEVKKHFDANSGLCCAKSSLARMLQSMNLSCRAAKRGNTPCLSLSRRQ